MATNRLVKPAASKPRKRQPEPAVPGRELFRAQAKLLKALAHEARLVIVDRLSRGECSAGELTVEVGLDQTTVSKHLAVLRSIGVIEDRREGSRVIYRLVTPCITGFFSCAVRVIREKNT